MFICTFCIYVIVATRMTVPADLPTFILNTIHFLRRKLVSKILKYRYVFKKKNNKKIVFYEAYIFVCTLIL